MLNLATTSDVIRVVTSAAADVDVFASYVDKNGAAITPGNQATQITTATTTTVVSAPAASTQRNVNVLYICNRDTTDSVTITVQFYDGAATEVISKGIGPGGVLVLDDLSRWTVMPSGLVTKTYLTTTGSVLTYTTPPGVTSLFVECVGAGGGGGSVTTAATNSAAGGGGGAGEYTCALVIKPTTSYSYYVPGGSAGNGDLTWFSTGTTYLDRILSAYGGGAGNTDGVAVIHVGGFGGNVGLGESPDSLPYNRAVNSGGTGLAIAAAQAVSGQGGSPWMYGAGGNSRKTTGAGNNGLGKGGGGSGGCILSGGANQSGGDGASGIIIVTEFR